MQSEFRYTENILINFDCYDIRVRTLGSICHPVGAVSIHSCHEIHHSFDSFSTITIKEEDIAFRPNDVLWIPPNTPHKSITSTMGKTHFYIQFDFILHDNKDSHSQTDPVYLFANQIDPFWFGNAPERIIYPLCEIVQTSNKTQWGQTPYIRALLTVYLTQLFRMVVGQVFPNYSLLQNETSLTQSIVVYIRDHYNQPLTLKELSQTFFMSERQINRHLKKHWGVSFKQALIETRIEYAKQFLINTDLHIDQIGEMVGFGSPSHFYMVFKQSVGQTPNEYRNNKRTITNSSQMK